MAETKTYGVRFLPVLMIVALVCVAAAAGLLLYVEQTTSAAGADPREMNELLALSQKMPMQAASALRGTAGAFDALAQSRSRFATLAQSLGPDVQSFEGSTNLLKHSQAVLGGREQVEAVHTASAEVRTMLPQLLQSLGNLASALGSTTIDGMARHLERFELFGQRMQHDMEALASGTPLVTTAAGGIGAVVETGVTALVVAERDAAGIASAIVRLTREPELRRGLGEAGRRLVQRQFGWDATAEQFEFAYRHALALHSARR